MTKKTPQKPVRQVRDRLLTRDEAAKYRRVREQVMEAFPPAKHPKLQPVQGGLGAQIRAAREARDLTWYAGR